MKKINLPHTLSEEELLNQLKDESHQTSIESTGNDILLFISTYNIQPGKEFVHKSILYRLYKSWSKDPVKKSTFGREIGLYFKPSGENVTINQNALKLSKIAQDQFFKRKRHKSRSPRLKARIELFMKQCGVSKGTFWLELDILFDLYDEWCYSKNRHPMSINHFFSILKLYLKHKVTKSGKVLAVDKSITNYISNERIENIRISRKKRNAQKAKKDPDEDTQED